MFKNWFKKNTVSEIIFPLIVPSTYFESGAFPAPHHPLPDARLSITWVLLTDGGMTYVNPEMSETLRRQGFNLQVDSFRLLYDQSKGLLATHEKRRDDGSLLWLGMMHQDGLGSSRLLLTQKLQRAFPEGYGIAIPERSCGIAFSQNLSAQEKSDVERLALECYEGSQMSPMLPELLAASAITIPSDWDPPHYA